VFIQQFSPVVVNYDEWSYSTFYGVGKIAPVRRRKARRVVFTILRP